MAIIKNRMNMEYLFIRRDFKGSVPKWNVVGQRRFNTNDLIYLRRLPSLYLILFRSAAVH